MCFFSRAALKCSTVKDGVSSVWIHTILKSLLRTSFLQVIQPCPNWPILRRRKFWTKHRCQDPEFDCSVFFSKYWRIVSKQSDHLFDTSEQLLSYFPRSTSIHSRRWYGNVTVEEEVVGIDVCFGLALATSFRVQSPMSSMWSSWVSSVSSVTNLFTPFTPRSSSMNECHLQRSWSWSRFRKGLATSTAGPIFVFPRIHPFTLDDELSRGTVYSRREPPSPIFQVPHRRGSWSTVPSPQSSWYLHRTNFRS